MAGSARKQAKAARYAAKQGTAGRPALEGIREPSGRLSRSARKLIGPDSVNEIKRVRDAALAGMRDSIWGTQLGRLFLLDEISAAQFNAGRKWAELVCKWRKLNTAPSINPKSGMAALDRVPGRDAEREETAADAAVLGLIDEVLSGFPRGSSDPTLLALRQCCELDIAPVGFGGMLLLQDGLNHLVVLWRGDT